MVKPPKPCIFCEKLGKQSKEHILARWLEDLFPRTAHDTHTQASVTWEGKIQTGLTAVTSGRSRQGRAHTRTARWVCENCNQGWLGKNQEDAQPVLKKLICGDLCDISQEEQRVISVWAAKVAMVAEFMNEGRRAIPQSHRSWLMNHLEPPNGWFIWIAGYNGQKWREGFQKVVAHLGDTPFPPENGNIVNAQSLMIGLEKLLVFAISTATANYLFNLQNTGRNYLHPLWPPPTEVILWPPAMVADDEHADLITYTLTRAFGLPMPR